MRKVSIKSLYRDLSREMDDLPFAVTKNGKIIGYMLSKIVKGIDNTEKRSRQSEYPMQSPGKGLDKTSIKSDTPKKMSRQFEEELI